MGRTHWPLCAAAGALCLVAACGAPQQHVEQPVAAPTQAVQPRTVAAAKSPMTPDGSAAPPGHSVHGEHAQAKLGAEPACAHPGKGHHAGHTAEYKVANAHHRFDDAERWAKVFEADKRDAWQRGDQVVKALKLAGTDKVADIGSATGYFTTRFARALPGGRVYGVDIEPDMVRYLARRAREQGLRNVVSVLGEASDPLLPEAVDVIFVCNTYHHITDRVAYFKRLLGALNKGGRIAVVDFKMGEIPVGPPPSHRIPADVITSELTAAGYHLLRRDDKLLPYQHVLIFGRQAGP